MVIYRLQPLDKLSKIDFIARKIDPYDESICVVSDSIAKIDKFTSGFENEAELKKFFMLDPNENLYIYYKQNGTRTTRLMYAKDDALKPFIDEENINVREDTPYFKNLLLSVLKGSSNKRYMDFIEKNGFIPKHLLELLEDYNKATTYDDQMQLIKRISHDLSNYKALRNLYIGTKTYEKAFNVNQHNNKQEDVEILDIDTSMPNKTEDDYMDEMERELYELYLRGGMDELMYHTNGMIPTRVLNKINEDAKTR